MRVLITGGAGFLGSNLASKVLENGDELAVFDNLFRYGSEKNLEWLNSLGSFKFYRSDVRNQNDVFRAIKEFRPEVIFHVAGQVAMTTSLENPRLDFEINVLGSINVLEACREYVPNAIICYSSTNKVYGDLEEFEYQEADSRYIAEQYPAGFPESVRLDFRTPYGCSKGAADQYMQDYYRRYGIRTVVFRHSSIYGGRQFSTYDQGWIGWFVQKAIDKKNGNNERFTISGSGKQVRDVLFSSDLIRCYYGAIDNIERTAGQVFNIGGGYENSLSLLELFSFLEKKLQIKMEYETLPVRASDQKVFIADIRKAKELFGWSPEVSKETGIEQMISWVRSIS